MSYRGYFGSFKEIYFSVRPLVHELSRSKVALAEDNSVTNDRIELIKTPKKSKNQSRDSSKRDY